MLFLFLLFVVTASSKVCIKTFEERSVLLRSSSVTSIEMKMNSWLDEFSDIEVINSGVYRSDDRYNSYHGGYITYRCESLFTAQNQTAL